MGDTAKDAARHSTSSAEPAEPQPNWPLSTREDCQLMVQRSLEKNMVVKFMLDKLEQAGCGVGSKFFAVENCDAQVGGGFRPPDGVVICHNHMGSQESIDQALVHELVHAYDHCRASNLDWSNCDHHACSEIRAATLSGDCSWKQEFLRGNYGIKGQHQVCVRRRAELSVSMNPHCGPRRAKASVDKMFDSCFSDTAPFDRRP